METWKEIKGYEGLYEVSSEGRVKSLAKDFYVGRSHYLKHQDEFIIKYSLGYGYPQVILYKDKTRKSFKIHRLVAETFIENPNNLPCVDHINGDRTDNRVENLRWVTYKENLNNPVTLIKFYGRKTRLGSHPTNETLKKMSESHKGKHWTTIQGKRVWY